MSAAQLRHDIDSATARRRHYNLDKGHRHCRHKRLDVGCRKSTAATYEIDKPILNYRIAHSVVGSSQSSLYRLTRTGDEV